MSPPEFCSDRKAKKDQLNMVLRKKLNDEALQKKQEDEAKRLAAEEEEAERKRKV